MNDAIVVINAGSSSLKFSLYSVINQQLQREAHGQIEGLGKAARFKAQKRESGVSAERTFEKSVGGFGYHEGFSYLADWIRDHFHDALSLLAVGHRVVHGGADFGEPTLIDAAVVEKLEALIPLAPLHQPHNLEAIKGAAKLRADIPQVACFDTAFHRGRESVTERFGLPDELFLAGLRRWGFHGLSYESIASQFRQIAPGLASGRVIVAHLGNGASLCAMKNGRSVDTTMGFSVLDGLPMGTRCGAIDPGVILFLLTSMTPKQVETMLYTKSGLLGISGVSNDVRELLASKEPLAAEAIDYFAYRIIREIGSLTATLGGLDALIFTAGIGENSCIIREKVCRGLSWLGIEISAEANNTGKRCVTREGATPSVWVIPTDEEGVIAAQTLKVVSHRGH
ncbi:MAG TPA: acetate/propionate family kinase [Tepidisphaeraceae bacterium]|jgi:acetate kinase|nr:acetate/propionate family kinase [Tepidisphaeraceae bacterium]